MKINFHAYHPILHQDNNVVFLANGNITLAYRVNLPEVFSLSEKDFEILHANWFQTLKGLPGGTVIHKQDIYLKQKYDGRQLPNRSYLAKATQNFFNDREYMSHDSYLFFSWPKNRNFNKATIANPFLKLNKNVPEKLESGANLFIQSVQDAVRFLNNTGSIELQELIQEEALKLTSNYFNGISNEVDTDILMDHKDLHIGDNLYGILAINSERCFADKVQTSKPNSRFTSDEKSFHQGYLDDLGLELHENHVLNQIVYLDDRSRWIGILNTKREELKKSINFGTQNKVILERIEDILGEINRDDQSRIIRGQTNILFWSTNKKNVSQVASNVQAVLKELDIIPYQPIGPSLYHYFLNSYFGFATEFANDDLYVTDLKHAVCLWINNTNYRNDRQGIIFNDRLFNIPVIKDVWDEAKKRIKARNFAIFAPTGEGKSFLANNILRQFFENGTRLVIIDLGGSYSKFAKLYPEEYIILRYEQGKNLGINPFYIQHINDLGPERIEDLTAFILELSAAGLKVAKEKQVALKKILQSYYREILTEHSLDSFYQYVSEKQEELLHNLAIPVAFFDPVHFLHIMSEYVAGGMYSFLFETSADQTYKIEDKRMIIFELDEVKDNKEILSVMLKLIKSAIQRTIWKNRSEKGIILFDEFAKQLKFENVLESVEFYYQAIRKQNGAIGIILQSINQLPQNATSASILENTQVIYSLHNEKGYDDLKNRLHLSGHDLNQLNSIRNNLTGDRKYTEIFIKIGKESNVFRLEVPPEVYAAYLTDGKESEAIMALYHKHKSMEKAIRHFISPS